MAIGGVYSYKTMSYLLPVLTFMVIRSEGGIKKISLQFPSSLVIFMLLLTWIGMSVFWAENQIAALKAFIGLSCTFIFSLYFFSCLMKATPNLIYKAYAIIKIAGFFLMLLIICQIFMDTFLRDLLNYEKVSPYMLRMKPTGSILGLVAFVGCGFLWIYEGKVRAIFIFCFFFCLIVLTFCQTALYGTILGIIIFGLSYFMPFLITRIGIISSYAFLIFSPLFYTYIFPPSMVAQSPYLKWLMNKSFYHRLISWEYFSKKFFENPLLGWGAESSRYLYLPTELYLAPGYERTLHPHNNSIQAYAELGIIGGILYALFFSSLFYMVERYVKDRLSIAVCNATITFGFVCAEMTHNAWRNYWLSLVVLTAGLIILFVKAREAQLPASADHLTQLRALSEGSGQQQYHDNQIGQEVLAS